MNWGNQAALTEMFSRSFAPLTQLSAGELALAQAQMERQYALQRAEAERAQALRDRMAIMAMQDEMERGRITMGDELAGKRTEAANKFTLMLAGLNNDASMARSVTAANVATAGNERLAAEARTATAVAEARKTAAQLGINDVDPTDPDYVNKVSTRAAEVQAQHRKTATSIQRELDGISKSLDDLGNELAVPANRQLQVAKRYLIAAEPDEAKRKAYKALTNLEAVMDAAAEVGALDKIETALKTEQLLRNQSFQKQAAPLVSKQTSLQRTLQALEQRGISPDWESLRAMTPPADGGTKKPPPSGGNDNLSDVFAPKTATPSSTTNHFGTFLSGFNPRNAMDAIGRVSGAVASGLTGGGFTMPEKSPFTTAGEAIGGFFGGTVGEEAARQKDQLATLQALIQRAPNPAAAARFRAARVAPEMPSLGTLLSAEADPQTQALIRSAMFNQLGIYDRLQGSN